MDIPFRLAGLVFALIQLIGSVILMSVVAWQVILLFLVIFALSAWSSLSQLCNHEMALCANELSLQLSLLVLIILVTLPASAFYPSLVIWNLCNVENSMISVERILEFTRIPSEAPLVIEGSRPNAGWPTEGKVELQNLQVQYHPALPMVIKGVTCTFPGNMKVGVMGRTRSGMSTLIQALFRIVEPSGGKILVDRLDISKLGCKT
ncbi:hypothetical protein ACFX11_011826 [Malus domestica]